MKIGIHNEASGTSVGGSEFCVAVLAEALRVRHEVEIVHHRADLSAEECGDLFGVRLDGVRLRYVSRDANFRGQPCSPWRHYREARRWNAALSEPYDLFVTFTHGVPPFCRAPAGVLVVLFPMFARPREWPWAEQPRRGFAGLGRRLRRAYYDWEWRQRLGTYRYRAAISHFAQEWTQRWWGIGSELLTPPVNTEFAERPKTESILCVGRFLRHKRQHILLKAFQDLLDEGLADWHFHGVGGLGSEERELAYWASLQEMSGAEQVHLWPNAPLAQVRRLYEEGSIFWHATGYGEDGDTNPGGLEHFGITTVEAMAAGCVPVVINKGGQPELVQHGVTGFVWDTLDELKGYTRQLIRDAALRQRLARAAREHARSFGREQFVQRFLELVGPSLT